MSEDDSYTRVRFHAQRGDGPDSRGDVTVEVSRTPDEMDSSEVRSNAFDEFQYAVDQLEDILEL